jgi:methylenetetrahydrofolate dehydrogenase (NADP+)/methenyltetrahydrofolate cyclohydrolase
MKLLDGKKASKIILSELKYKIKKITERNNEIKIPKIAIVLVGDNPSSMSYVKSKLKISSENNFNSQLFFYSDFIQESDLLKEIDKLNISPDIDGIIVELPLPKHISQEKIINSISPQKDIDGFNPINFGKMSLGQKAHRPATAYGILKLLEFYKIDTSGKHIVVIGRSNIVGKPISIMLGNDFNVGRATVTSCDINTPIELLREESKRADIIIVAAGKVNLLTEDMIKNGAIVIDVGINVSGGTIVGDCDFEKVSPKCEWITPVPGGVGPMTICALLLNTFATWYDKNKILEEKINSVDYTVQLIENVDQSFPPTTDGKKLIGTYDHNRIPGDNEVIHVIGDYPVGRHSLITENPSFRHYKWAMRFNYDSFEGNPCWDGIDDIWIINDTVRQDRLYDTLKEFKKIGIPLNKVKIQPAEFNSSTGNNYANKLIGCFKSHLKIFEQYQDKDFKHLLIFEDDFTFSDPIEESQKQIREFVSRDYEYDVLLFSTSCIGQIIPIDDLISESKQPCTTTAGYMISKKGLEKVIPLWHEGINGLLGWCDFNQFACDKYWTKIQKDGQMLSFNRKIGYQRPSYSTTLGNLSYNLD